MHRLRKENPGKTFIGVSEQAICPDMKLITLDKVLRSLEEMEPRVRVTDTIRNKAGAAIDAMLATPLGGGIRGDVATEKLPSVRR